MTRSLFWFRDDLRLADNPGLAAAVGAGEAGLVYVLDDEAGPWRMGGANRWWLHHSLQSLQRDIAAQGGVLLLRRGKPGQVIPELASALQAKAVHASRGFEPFARAQERAVEDALAAAGIVFRCHHARLLFDPERIATKSGTPYGVYTPFARACFGQPPVARVAAPERLAAVSAASDRLEDWRLLPTRPDWAGGLRACWTPGEAGAARRLRAFLDDGVAEYDRRRDLPAEDGTSGLSPHLHFGEISPARLWHETEGDCRTGAAAFRKELLWREFSAYLLWHHPEMPETPLRPEFAKFPWAADARALRAWQRGRTGIPIVDAGMRQLWQTGWMHNRVRMICASFLVKHLRIAWQQGEAWFWDTLVDADLGNNSAGWQWVAGCGADAAPFFRIFNPVLQGRKFDPDGAYVRRFVPELGRLPDAHIHAPWAAPGLVLAEAGIALGKDYPHPIADLGQGRERALAAYRSITGRK